MKINPEGRDTFSLKFEAFPLQNKTTAPHIKTQPAAQKRKC